MNSKGFTMIELVMVILIIGILSVIQLPKMERQLELELLQIEKKFMYNLTAAGRTGHAPLYNTPCEATHKNLNYLCSWLAASLVGTVGEE